MEELFPKFKKCLEAKYNNVENSGSYAVERKTDKLYIIFEKSNGKEDWKNNLDFPSVPYNEMESKWRCHRGFLRTWKSIEPYLKETILDRQIKNIEIIGYSHGGALAILCHEYVWYNREDLRNNLISYAFGAPRVIYRLKTEEILKRWDNLFVIVNEKDLVTKLPPKLFGYRNVGKYIYIGKKPGCCSIEDHKPENYIESIKEYDAKQKADGKTETVKRK